MFGDHQPMIARHAGTPQGFADVVAFVIATQNQHFHRVGTIIDDIHDVGIDSAGIHFYLTREEAQVHE